MVAAAVAVAKGSMTSSGWLPRRPRTFTGKITYAYTIEANGQTAEQEWTIAQRPPDSRFEIVSTMGRPRSRALL